MYTIKSVFSVGKISRCCTFFPNYNIPRVNSEIRSEKKHTTTADTSFSCRKTYPNVKGFLRESQRPPDVCLRLLLAFLTAVPSFYGRTNQTKICINIRTGCYEIKWLGNTVVEREFNFAASVWKIIEKTLAKAYSKGTVRGWVKRTNTGPL